MEGLNQFLLKQNAEGRTVVLVIDEAQDLEASVLEQIRLISNLETDRDKLIQIVLSGQPELVQILKKNEIRQLSQRITVNYHLQPMDFQDTVRYINHRLEVAGGKGGVIFSKGAMKRIYRYSRGFPRLINAACDRALLASYTRDITQVNSRIAGAGIKDMRWDGASPARRRRLILIPAFGILLLLFAAGFYLTRSNVIDRFIASKPVEATEEQMKKASVITGEGLSRAMTAELGKVSESESARRGFNSLAGFWKVAPVPESDDFNLPDGMERAALDRDLLLYRFSGNLGVLLRIDYPAVLEMTLPGIPEKRFVALVGTDYDQLLVAPPVGERRSLTFSEVEKHWSGHGFLLWKDPLHLMASPSSGVREGRVRQLQSLLSVVGAYRKPLTGVYDNDTLLAIKEFQSSKGIKPDGIVGGQTLMLLYNAIDLFEVPTLAEGRK
jgi:general secretion pathway protein A